MLIGIFSTIVISVILKKAKAYKKFAIFRNSLFNLVLAGSFFTLGGLFLLLISDRNP